MKYHKHEIIKYYDEDIEGGCMYRISRNQEFITYAWTLENAKEFIDTFDGINYDYNVLC